MKTLAASILICLSLSALTAFSLVRRESCSCSSPDGNCSASVDCTTGGCWAVCPSGACQAKCFVAGAERSPGAEDGTTLKARIRLRLKDSSSREVAAELARVTRSEVKFSPTIPGDTFTLDVTDEPLWNVLETLSARGRVWIGDEDFATLQYTRQLLLRGDRISVCISGVTAKQMASELEYLTGLDIKVTSGDPNTRVYLTSKTLSLYEIVEQASASTGLQITVK